MRQALAQTPGVTRIEYNSEKERFTVHYRGGGSRAEEFKARSLSAVWLPGLSRSLATLGRRLGLKKS